MNDKLLGDIAAQPAQWAANSTARAITQISSLAGFGPGSECR
jgi:hypothetical protein